MLKALRLRRSVQKSSRLAVHHFRKRANSFLFNRGGIEDTRLEAKAKDTKKIRGQGQGQPFQGQTLSRPRTGMLEAKAKDQGHKRKCSPKTKKKGLLKKFLGDLQKKGLHKKFLGDLQKKRSSQKFFRRSPKKRSSQKFFKQSPQKNVFQKIFQALHEILTIQKILLFSSRGQANFRELEAKAKDLTFEAKDFKMCPRGQGRPRGLHLCYLSLFQDKVVLYASIYDL